MEPPAKFDKYAWHGVRLLLLPWIRRDYSETRRRDGVTYDENPHGISVSYYGLGFRIWRTSVGLDTGLGRELFGHKCTFPIAADHFIHRSRILGECRVHESLSCFER